MNRCSWSDLLEDECGHCTGALKTFEDSALPDMPCAIDGTYRVAEFTGFCEVCRFRITKGDDIILAQYEGVADTLWCHTECTRAPNGGLA